MEAVRFPPLIIQRLKVPASFARLKDARRCREGGQAKEAIAAWQALAK
jgi:hypothetical protein